MSWLKDRFNALVDNLIWIGLVALAVLVGGSLIAFGNERADLPVWAVVLFGAVLIGCVVAIVILFHQIKRVPVPLPPEPAGRAVPLAEPPHPHAKLLRRIDALTAVVGERDPSLPAEWTDAAAFNGILRDARAEADDPLLREIDEIERSREEGWDSLAYSATYGTIKSLLAQVRSIVE